MKVFHQAMLAASALAAASASFLNVPHAIPSALPTADEARNNRYSGRGWVGHDPLPKRRAAAKRARKARRITRMYA